MDKETWAQWADRRLDQFPLLRILLFDVWFRAAFLFLIFLSIGAALFLSKMWRTSPAGFEPVIRVSGLDLMQARALKRTAQAAMTSGKFAEADFAWRSAMANNPGDPELLRGLLANRLGGPRLSPAAARETFSRALRLLQLSATNTADLALTARLLEKQGDFRSIDQWLSRRELTLDQEVLLMKAWFHLGQIPRLKARWDSRPALREAPELELYRAAYQAGWGPPGTIQQGHDRLEAAANAESSAVTAWRLQLAVSAQRQDAAGCRAALERLSGALEASLSDYTRYWRLLISLGDVETARRSVLAGTNAPATAGEISAWVEICLDLQLEEHALDRLRRETTEWAPSLEFWSAYSRVLARLDQWDQLSRIAYQMRRVRGPSLQAYSYFLEGWAEWELGRTHRAELAFQRILEFRLDRPVAAMRMATGLLEVNQPKIAETLLLDQETALGRQAEYWHLICTVAQQLKSLPLLIRAARAAHEIEPDKWVHANNYAAALILAREQPVQALQLTFRLVLHDSNSVPARINHAFALLGNHRGADAESVLNGVEPGRLSPEERSAYALCQFELGLELGQTTAALEAGRWVKPEYLYPSQLAWFEEAKLKLARQVASP